MKSKKAKKETPYDKALKKITKEKWEKMTDEQKGRFIRKNLTSKIMVK